jgi:hypothetical protein
LVLKNTLLVFREGGTRTGGDKNRRGGEGVDGMLLNVINIKKLIIIYRKNIMNRCKCCWHKHKTLMDFFNLNPDDSTEVFTPIQLTKMVKELHKRDIEKDAIILTLKNEITKLKCNSNRKRKKNIEEYLKQHAPSILSEKWLDTLEITADDFDLLAHYDYKECMVRTLKRLLTGGHPFPFCAFSEMKHNVYVYKKTGEDEGWYKMESDDVTSIVYKLHGEFLKFYWQWSADHSSNDKMKEIISFYFTKMNYYEIISCEMKITHIRKFIFDTLNKPMKHIIEFE